jgi:phytanoyl-CoA hydroxylase
MRTGSLAARFERDGFLVLPGFKTRRAVADVRARATEIVDAFDPAEAIAMAGSRERSSAYYRASGDKIRCFLEDGVVNERGALRRPKQLSVAKMGQAMHVNDPVFERFSFDARLHDLVVALGFERPLVYQSMYLFKQPHIGSETLWHHDAPYRAARPLAVVTLWFALERADRANGCLWVRPGGHHALDAMNPEPVEVDAGTLVVMHGLLPHSSGPNRSAESRHAYTLHVFDGREPWPPQDWYDPVVAPRSFVEPVQANGDPRASNQ